MAGLGNLSTYGTAVVSREIYKALGVPTNQGYSQDGGHGHCSFPADQNAPLTAFVQKFLFGQVRWGGGECGYVMWVGRWVGVS